MDNWISLSSHNLSSFHFVLLMLTFNPLLSNAALQLLRISITSLLLSAVIVCYQIIKVKGKNNENH